MITAKGIRTAAFNLSIEIISHCKTIPEAQQKIKSFMKDLNKAEKELKERTREWEKEHSK